MDQTLIVAYEKVSLAILDRRMLPGNEDSANYYITVAYFFNKYVIYIWIKMNF